MKFPTVLVRRLRARPSAPRHRSVDLILFVFMVLVFGPVIGLHVGYAVLGGSAGRTGAPTAGIAKTTTETMVASRHE